MAETTMGSSPKILILYNARSGHRQVNFQTYLNALHDRGAQTEMRMINKRFNLAELLSDAAKFDRIVVAGGDGTVSAAAGILKDSSIPIMAYPGGTANLLARNLQIPANAQELAEITLHGEAVRTDLGVLEFVRYRRRDFFRRRVLKKEVKGTPVQIYFAIMAGCGFVARLMSQAKPWKSRLGEAAYWISGLQNLFPRRAEFQLQLDGSKEVNAKGIGILMINFEKIQFDLKVVSEARAHDGKIEIMLVKARSLFGILPILWGAIRERLGFSRPRLPEVMETYQASEVEIKTRPPLKLQFDGEILQKASQFKVKVCPGAALFVYGPAANPAAKSSENSSNRS